MPQVPRHIFESLGAALRRDRQRIRQLVRPDVGGITREGVPSHE